MSGDVVPVVTREARAWAGDALTWWAEDALTWAEDALLLLFPQGGQAGSRRNAWLAMAGEAALAAARRESQEALGHASARAQTVGLPPVAVPSAAPVAVPSAAPVAVPSAVRTPVPAAVPSAAPVAARRQEVRAVAALRLE